MEGSSSIKAALYKLETSRKERPKFHLQPMLEAAFAATFLSSSCSREQPDVPKGPPQLCCLSTLRNLLAKCAKEREQKRVMFWKDALKLEHMTTRQQCPSRREEGLPPLRPGRCAAHKEMPRLAWGETGTAHSALPYLLSPFDLVS
ncbi:hypothetical protein B296_00042032 [Ensete ventricosum]|uniref:Uncharacterized protein n=1 Tax=Ensete ventricosum TaxID=4639 RepID=A0A426X758_ENSVE|nr:hypothetical protein B296_00042032 [Ensete ventricosum]